MKIIFEIDSNNDESMVFFHLRNYDWEFRSKEMGIDLNIAKVIHMGKGDLLKDAENKITKMIKKAYIDYKDELEKAKIEYQKSWDEIIKEFSDTVSQTTYPWVYNKYIVDVTLLVPGFSNWGGNTVGMWCKEGSVNQRPLTAHEILLAHFFSIHRKVYKSSGLTDKQVWALAEIFAFAMTRLEPKLTKFWPSSRADYYTDHNYPEIVPLQKALKDPFINRASFDEYVKKGIDLVGKLYKSN
jgi:hypothetical protein